MQIKEEPEEKPNIHEFNDFFPMEDGLNICQVCESTKNLHDVTFEDNLREELSRMIPIQDERVTHLLKYLCQNCKQKVEGMIEFRKQYEITYQKLIEVLDREGGKIIKREEGIASPDAFAVERFVVKMIDEESPSEKPPILPPIQRLRGVKKVQAQQQFICPVCGYNTTKDIEMRNHIKTHEDKFYECKYCTLTFKELVNFKAHVATHKGPNNEEVYQCLECPRAFRFSGSFKRHMLEHEKNRRHKCTICEKSFGKKSEFHSHMRTHSKRSKYNKELPYNCKICEAPFGEEANLNRHMDIWQES